MIAPFQAYVHVIYLYMFLTIAQIESIASISQSCFLVIKVI